MIADSIGWRWCFLLQVPVSAIALGVGFFVVANQAEVDSDNLWKGIWAKVDISGSLLLVTALSVQLLALSLGGNELPWSSPWVIGALVGSFVLLGLFIWVEARTSSIPIIPLRMFSTRLSISVQLANLCGGIAAYAVRLSGPNTHLLLLLTFDSTSSCSRSSSRSSCWTLQLKLEVDSRSHHLLRRSAA